MTPPTGYSEDALVEQPAVALLEELGWEKVRRTQRTFFPFSER